MSLYYNVVVDNLDNNFYLYSNAIEFAQANSLQESDVQVLQRPWNDPHYLEYFNESLSLVRLIADYNDYTRLLYSEYMAAFLVILPSPNLWVGQDIMQNAFAAIANARQSGGSPITQQQIKTLRELLWKYYMPFDLDAETGEMFYRNVE